MTLLDVRNRVLTHFTTNDTMCPEDFASIKIDEPYESARDNLILRALEQLEEVELIARVEEDLWILVEPLNANGQDIHISTNVANGVAMVINAYLDANGIEGGRADTLNVGEADILALITIIGNVINLEPKQDPDPDLDGPEDYSTGSN